MTKVKKFNESGSIFDEQIYLEKIEVVKDINPIKAGMVIDIKFPLLFLVGDNGAGKSTLMECLGDTFGFQDDTYLKRQKMKDNIKLTGKPCKVQYLDFHAGDKKFAAAFGDNIEQQMHMMKASAGESTILQMLGMAKFVDGLLILDEPCRGLSIKNQIQIGRIIEKKFLMDGCQVICSTHSDIILRKFKKYAQYYEVKFGKDITYKEYVTEQGLEVE